MPLHNSNSEIIGHIVSTSLKKFVWKIIIYLYLSNSEIKKQYNFDFLQKCIHNYIYQVCQLSLIINFQLKSYCI